jgi:hypothetical protein
MRRTGLSGAILVLLALAAVSIVALLMATVDLTLAAMPLFAHRGSRNVRSAQVRQSHSIDHTRATKQSQSE